jgi:methionine synthase I (cobalamin-dependent)
MMGTTPEQAAARLVEAGADVIGANCGCGIEGYVPICARLRAATDRPVWIKANAGLPELVEGRVTYRMTAEEFAGHARKLVELGAAFIGGCCGTSPEYIRALRSLAGAVGKCA